MSEMDLLLWARGPGLQIAVAALLAGTVLRLAEIFGLGRKRDLAVPRPGTAGSGWRTVFSRSLPRLPFMRGNVATYLLGYAFHLGLFAALFLFVPHIRLFQSLFGFGWPGLPSALVDAASLLTIAALAGVLILRLTHPVKRFLSTFDDYLAWALTTAPILTGYLAFHHLALPYTAMLAVHILSAELLLVCLPFTKLAHTFSFAISRWYNGSALGRKGVTL